MQTIDNYKQAWPLIKMCTGESFEKEHWRRLFTILNLPKDVTTDNLKFGHLTDSVVIMIAKAKDRYRSIWDQYGIDGFDLSHLVALDKGGPNVWSNLELLPRKLNVEQLTAPYFAYSRGLTGRGEKGSLLSDIANRG